MSGATWVDLRVADPDMADFGERTLLWEGFVAEGKPQGLAYLATVRPDGGPRLHILMTFLQEGRLFVAIEPQSPKLRDLRRDGRYMLHAYSLREGDFEFSVRGTAREVTDQQEHQRLLLLGVGFVESMPLFELFIERADSTYYEDWAGPNHRPVRRKWVAT